MFLSYFTNQSVRNFYKRLQNI